jgi:hypothetical protein
VASGFSRTCRVTVVASGFSRTCRVTVVASGFSRTCRVTVVASGFSRTCRVTVVASGFSRTCRVTAVIRCPLSAVRYLTSGTSPAWPPNTMLQGVVPFDGRTYQVPVEGRYTAASVRPSPS